MHNTTAIDFRYIEIESDQTIFDLFCALGASENSFLLDSSKVDSPYSRFSMIGINPHLVVKYENKKIYIKDYLFLSKEQSGFATTRFASCFGSKVSLNASCQSLRQDAEKKNFPIEDQSVDAEFVLINETDIFNYLNRIIADFSMINTTHLPFIGGGIGYFSYELARELEVLPQQGKSDVNLPDCYYVFYDNVVLKEISTSKVYITGLGLLDTSRRSISAIRQKLESAQYLDHNKSSDITSLMIDNINPFVSPFDQTSYMTAVETMKDYIEEGHIYIANMTHTFKGDFNQDPLETYARLRSVNPAPFSAYLSFDSTTILCSSPERFLKIEQGKVQTRPIKGTIPRGKTTEEDEENQRLLMASEKDKSELLMIVDLERNDLSKVCVPGSVVVTELFEIEAYATVFHLVATIEGQLQKEKTPIDCIKATFPGGSITGAPKIRAMEIIDSLEPTTRNLYTGCIGYIGYDHTADFNIIIRTIVVKDSKAYIGVGGGITWESDPLSEYAETLQKAKALFTSLGIKRDFDSTH